MTERSEGRRKLALVGGIPALAPSVMSYPESAAAAAGTPAPAQAKHSHYFKPVHGLEHVDVYRVLHLFNVTDPCLQHAVKKLLVAGGRGGGKDISRDIQEAIDTLERWKAMREEELQQASLTRGRPNA